MATTQDEHLKDLFDNPESGPDETEGKTNLPEKGSVLGDGLSETEEQQARRTQDEEDGLTSRSTRKTSPEGGAGGEDQPVEAETQAQLAARLSSEAEARRKEITRVRRSRAADRKELKTVKDELASIKKAITGEDDSELAVQAQLDANPALKKIYDRLSSFEQQQKQRQPVELSEEEMDTAREVMEYGLESVTSYRKHTPDWDHAYAFLREQQAQAAGINHWDPKLRDQQLNAWEHEFTQMLYESGIDPAQAIYEQAKKRGWRSGQAVAQPANGQRQTVLPQRTLRRIRDAVTNPSLSTTGNGGMGGGDTISREEFYRRYDKNQRVAIYNSAKGEDIFERLATEGQVPVSLLI